MFFVPANPGSVNVTVTFTTRLLPADNAAEAPTSIVHWLFDSVPATPGVLVVGFSVPPSWKICSVFAARLYWRAHALVRLLLVLKIPCAVVIAPAPPISAYRKLNIPPLPLP